MTTNDTDNSDLLDVDEDAQFAEWFREVMATMRRAPENTDPGLVSESDIEAGLKLMRSLTPEEIEGEGPAVELLIERAKRLGWKPGVPLGG